MYIKYLTVILMTVLELFSLDNHVIAQQPAPANTITGMVADSATREPLAGATIRLLSSDRALVGTVAGTSTGAFTFTALEARDYVVEFTVIGYPPAIMKADLSNKTHFVLTLKTLYLAKKTNTLQTATVTSVRPVVKQEIDRITYDLQADPQSKSSSVLEMMRKVPYLSLDGDENILLKGNASYRIFINGKPSGMMERNPKEVLRSMPASTIQRIEVITNPSSKYDAEGLAGIINIVTNKKTGNGYNGTISLNGRFPVGGPGVGVSFSARQDKFGISAYGGGSMYSTPMVDNHLNRRTSGLSETALEQDGTIQSDSRSGYFGTELSYEIDSLQLLSGQVNVNGNDASGTTKQLSRLLENSGMLQQYRVDNNNTGSGRGLDAALNYQLGFRGDKSKLLTFSYRYSGFANRQDADLDIWDLVNYHLPDYRQENHTNALENTFQADYVQQRKKLSIEAGVKGIFRRNTSNFQYHTANAFTGKFDLDSGRTNRFDYHQDIFGAYNTYQYTLKTWELKAGARIEQTVTNANFASTGTKLSQNYFNIIPSLAAKKTFKNSNSLNLGFMQRIKRPGINRLNPFVDRSNPNYESSGNPDLRAVLNNRLQVAYSRNKKLTINTGLDVSYVKNIDLRVSYLDTATNITKSRFENTGEATALDYSINLSYPVTKQWNASINSTVTFIWIEGYVGTALIRDQWFLYAVNASTAYRFNRGWRLNASVAIISANPTSLQGNTNGMVFSSLSVNKEIVKNKLTFSAGLNNPFTTYRDNITRTWGPDFMEVITNRNYFRQCNLSVNYNFGKLKQAIRKNKRGIRNDDMSEGKGL